MGIEGLDNLKGETMIEEQQNDQAPPVSDQQQDESASPPPEQVDPPTPAHEEIDRVNPDSPDPSPDSPGADSEPQPSNDA